MQIFQKLPQKGAWKTPLHQGSQGPSDYRVVPQLFSRASIGSCLIAEHQLHHTPQFDSCTGFLPEGYVSCNHLASHMCLCQVTPQKDMLKVTGRYLFWACQSASTLTTKTTGLCTTFICIYTQESQLQKLRRQQILMSLRCTLISSTPGVAGSSIQTVLCWIKSHSSTENTATLLQRQAPVEASSTLSEADISSRPSCSSSAQPTDKAAESSALSAASAAPSGSELC